MKRRKCVENQGKRHASKARDFLKGKKWMKAKRLAPVLGIRPQEAGQVLAYLPEWAVYDEEQRNSRLWMRVSQ